MTEHASVKYNFRAELFANVFLATGLSLSLLLLALIFYSRNNGWHTLSLAAAFFCVICLMILFFFIRKATHNMSRIQDGLVASRAGYILNNQKLESEVHQIKKTAEKYKRLLEAAPDAIIIAGKNGDVEMVNRQAEKMFGYNREEIIGQKLEMLMPDRYRDMHQNHRNHYFDNPRPRGMGEGFELFGRKKDGAEFFVEISLSPLETEDGLLVSAAIRDISERKKAANAIQMLNTDLEKNIGLLEVLNNELEAFTYSVSHDLRSPLRIIDGFASILVTDYADKLDAEGKRALGVIMKNAQRMGRLIDDLLNLSRLGRQEMVLSHVNMNKLVHTVIQEQHMLGHTAAITCDPLLPAYCDNNLVRQVWSNLISNAIKYSGKQAGPEIRIGCNLEANNLIYYVKDNGVGFDMQYADKLFGVFQRLHKITEFEGTGVGLALVHRIITRHNGRVWAAAEANKGATFFFSLPVHDPVVKGDIPSKYKI